MNRTIIKSKVDFARKQANQAIGIPDRNRADLHAARAAVVHTVAYAFAHGHRHNVGDARMHAHCRTQVDELVRIGRGLVAVHGNAQAAHIKVGLREAIRCRGVIAMDNARVEARRFDRTHCFDEALDLDLEVERFQAVCRSEMGKAALKL